jgi:aldehyde dehydrogenase family protein
VWIEAVATGEVTHAPGGRPLPHRALFPLMEDVPAAADFAPGGGSYPDGALYLVDGEVRRWTGDSHAVTSPVCVATGGTIERRLIGHHAALTKEEALGALAAAVRAHDHGRGAWPTMKVGARVEAVEAFAAEMQKVREGSVRLLMWEIGKTRSDCEREFDRTVQYVLDTVEALKEMDRSARPGHLPLRGSQGQRRGHPLRLRRPAVLLDPLDGGRSRRGRQHPPPARDAQRPHLELREHGLPVLRARRGQALVSAFSYAARREA